MIAGEDRPDAPPRRDRHVLVRDEAIDRLRVPGDRVTWLGQAGFDVRLGATRLVIDPFLDEWASPVRGVGPRRLDPSPLRPEDLADPDVILLSHNHYDHLDRLTLGSLPGRRAAVAIVPEGLGPYVREFGLADVVELPWGAAVRVGGVEVTAVPAIHFSGRGLLDRNRTHWNGYVLDSGRRRVYFAGDTAYSPLLGPAAVIGGACDLALVPIGAYLPAEVMAAVHATPEEAIRLARDAGAARVLGMHWGTISLSTEPMFEPPARFVAAGRAAGFAADAILLPAIGGTVALDA